MKTAEKSYINTVRNAVKIYPIIYNFVVLIVSFMDITWDVSIDIHFMFSVSVGHSIYVCALLLALSKLFKFCMWHRILIWNMLFCLIPSFITQINPDIAYTLIPAYISLIISTSFSVGAIISVFINNIIKNGNKQQQSGGLVHKRNGHCSGKEN